MVINKFYEPKQDYKVLCHCCTYNQAQYITETMDGFTMQKTSFPFVCYIIDDASTDGEQKVIGAYLDEYFDMTTAEYVEIESANIIIAKHKENKNCSFAVYFLKRNLWNEQVLKNEHIIPWREHCEYEAICEGDDYWISKDKLQRQVTALENNTHVNMCACTTLCYKDGQLVHKMQPALNDEILTIEETIKGGGGYVGTNSLLFRTSLYQDAYVFWKRSGLDYFLQIHGALNGGILFLSEPMAAYRVSSTGSWCDRMRSNHNGWYRQKLDVIYTLNTLDEETNKRYNDVIEKDINNKLFTLFHIAIQGSVFDDSIRSLSFMSKLKMIYMLAIKLFTVKNEYKRIN